MTTPLQQAAQALLTRWDSMNWKDALHTAHFIDALRKALDAEIAQSVGPVLWITDLDDPIICKTEFETATFCEDDQRPIPVYLHPPQQVAVTSGERAELIQWLRRAHEVFGNKNSKTIADMLEADAQQAKRAALSDDEIDTIMRPLTQNTAYSWRTFARAIEAHHGIGGEA